MKIEEIRADRDRLKRLFATEDGKKVLAHLQLVYRHDTVVGKDTHETYLRIGNNEVFDYIDQVIGEKNDDMAE